MEVKKKKMETKKGEGKGQRQKVVIGIFAAVVIAALFTVTIGIGMNNSDTGNGVVGMGGLGDTITAYGVEDEATVREDVMLHGLLAQEGKFKVTAHDTQVIYEGTSGFFLTITAKDNSDRFYVKYYVDGDKKTSTRLEKNQATTLSYGYGKGEHKRVVISCDSSFAITGEGKYKIF